jgi:lactoylglutathione lyase
MTASRFAYTIVYVPDVARSVAFYQTVFGCAVRFMHESGQYAELDTGEVTLAFAGEALADLNLPAGYQRQSADRAPFGMELAFLTDEVDAAVGAAVQAGGQVLSPATEKPWGQVVAYVRDPDGVLLEIATPVIRDPDAQ